MGDWRVRAIRGATTVEMNTTDAIRSATQELLDAIEDRNLFDPTEIVSVTFSVTRDIDAQFPAAIARERANWDNVPLLDVQQMYVQGSLERCIRILLHLNSPLPQAAMQHVYLRGARHL